MRLTRMILVAAAAAVLAGCAAQGSRVGADFGRSYRLAIANQVLVPEAGQNLAPVEGMSGDAAQKVYDRYIKQLERPERQAPFMFPLGSTGSQGGQSGRPSGYY